MSISLPKELKTSKVETLPDDLKSIAEKMLAEKFGIEEEVLERKSPPSFRGKCDCYGGSSADSQVDNRYGYGRDFDPGRRYPEAEDWQVAFSLLRKNLYISEEVGIVFGRSEIRMIDTSNRLATVFAMQATVNRWMSDDMRGNFKEVMLEEIARQYKSKIDMFPRGRFVIDY